MKNIAAFTLLLSIAGATVAAQNGVRSLLSRDLVGAANRELTMITVDYGPGESTPAHTHGSQAMLYVLEGSVVMQVKGGNEVTLGPGQTFYEGPEDVHVVSRNAGKTKPAKYVVFIVKPKSAPILTPVK